MSIAREVTHRNHTARWRADVQLSTGKVLTHRSEWKQAHWDEHSRARDSVVATAKRLAKEALSAYGVATDRIVVTEEHRSVASIEETTLREKFHSEHFVSAS